MKIKSNLEVKKVGDAYLLITTKENELDLSKIINLNATTAFLLNECGNQSFTAEQWTQCLTNKYEVSQEKAAKDVAILIGQLKTLNLLED